MDGEALQKLIRMTKRRVKPAESTLCLMRKKSCQFKKKVARPHLGEWVAEFDFVFDRELNKIVWSTTRTTFYHVLHVKK